MFGNCISRHSKLDQEYAAGDELMHLRRGEEETNASHTCWDRMAHGWRSVCCFVLCAHRQSQEMVVGNNLVDSRYLLLDLASHSA